MLASLAKMIQAAVLGKLSGAARLCGYVSTSTVSGLPGYPLVGVQVECVDNSLQEKEHECY